MEVGGRAVGVRVLRRTAVRRGSLLLVVAAVVVTGWWVGLFRPSAGPICPASPTRPSAGGAASLGLTVGSARVPRWSQALGLLGELDGSRAFAVRNAGCVVAVDVRSGVQLWSRAIAKGPPVIGLVAGSKVVVAAVGRTRGQAPAMVYPVTVELVGLDPSTGAQLWSLALADDGQGVPAVVAGDQVVITEADGTVLGLDAATGRQRWRDTAPNGCEEASPQGGLTPKAVVLPGGPAVTIAYRCAAGQQIQRLDAINGARRWTSTLSPGWSVQDQSPVGATSDVIGLVISGTGALTGTTPAAPMATVTGHSTLGAGVDVMTDSVLALNSASGAPLWQIDDVLPSAGVYGGGGQLCASSGFGLECYTARTGVLSWRQRPPVTPSAGGPGDASFSTAVSNAGRLYLTIATSTAQSVPAGSTTYRSPPGTFTLTVLDMATGRTQATMPLPAFYSRSGGVVVSVDGPPGVLAVSDGSILLSPQLHETDVVEAFATP